MEIACDPKSASAEAIAHICPTANGFISRTTFPDVHTLEQYADDHGQLMKQVNDLHFVTFDVFFTRGDRVCMRYTAEGTHSGEPNGKIPPSGRKSQWTAYAIFRVENGKLAEFIKEWNKLVTWEQFGWPGEECLTFAR